MPELARYVELGAAEDEQLTVLKQNHSGDGAATQRKLHADLQQLGPLLMLIKTNDGDRGLLARTELQVLQYLTAEQAKGRVFSGFSVNDGRVRMTELRYVLRHHYRLQLSGDSKLGAINQLTRTMRGETPFTAVVVVIGLWVVALILPEKRTRQRELINLSPAQPGTYYWRRTILFAIFAELASGLIFALSLALLTPISGWGNAAYPLVSVNTQGAIGIVHSGTFAIRYLLCVGAFIAIGSGLGALIQVYVRGLVVQIVGVLGILVALTTINIPNVALVSTDIQLAGLVICAWLVGAILLGAAIGMANWRKQI